MRGQETGDIVVFGKTKDHKNGHIAIYDGKQWISDYKQDEMNPYRVKSSAGAHTVYRFPGTLPAVIVRP